MKTNFKSPFRLQKPVTIWLIVAVFTQSSAAFALQPLSTFIEGADKNNPQQRESAAVVAQREAEEKATTWHLLPSLSVTGSYTRNQYERNFMFPGSSEAQPFMPLNQFDAAVTLSVPIINVAAWEQKATSSALRDLSEASEQAIRQDLKHRVVRAYYQLFGTAAVRAAAEENLKISNENLGIVEQRRDAGAATELEIQRARSEVARAEQDLVTSEFAYTVARRTLFSLTGVEAKESVNFPEDDLHPEAALEFWTHAASASPALEVSQAARRATESQTQLAKAAWYPTITGSAQERLTNATALVGHSAYYLFQLGVAWRFEGSNLHLPEAQRAQTQAALAHEVGTQNEIYDAVFQAWHQVKSGILRSQAARKQDEAAEKAAQIALDQYKEGATTQLEVLAAQQAAFGAEVARIQADTDLVYARAALRVIAARPLESPSNH